MKKWNQRGQGLIEYIIIVSIVSVGCMAVMRYVSKHMNHKLAQISDVLQGKEARKNSKDKIEDNLLSKRDLNNFFKSTNSKEK